MQNNRKWILLVSLTAVAGLAFFAVGNAHAWGPLSQTAIANAAQRAEGMPQATDSRTFVSQAVMPKVFEYTEHSYANYSFDFTDLMMDYFEGIVEYGQALSWGCAQAAERVGDHTFFRGNSQGGYDRFINELLADALLFAVDSPYHGTAVAEVSVMPKLVSDTTYHYIHMYGGDSVSGLEMIEKAYYQAHFLIGELALLQNENFRYNALERLSVNDWLLAMDQSVEAAVDYAVNTNVPQTQHWLSSYADDYGNRILMELGKLLVATGQATIEFHKVDGVYHYRVELISERVNDFTIFWLRGLAFNVGEHPIRRNIAGQLLYLMTHGGNPE